MSTSRSAKGTDPALDQLLLGLAAGAEAPDDDAWVKRVASRAGPFAGTPALSRSELDALLAAPLPDDASGDFDPAHAARDDHAAHAADHHGGDWDAPSIGATAETGAQSRVSSAQEVRGMEESMSEEEAPKKNDLGALAGLTRSSLAAPAPGGLGEIDGAAKADDSGRIDLRAMMGGGESSNDADGGVAAAAAAGKPDDNVIDIGAIQRASAAPKRVSTAPVVEGSGTPVSAAPSTTGAAAMSAAAKPGKPADKKGGALFIGLGLAAAAAIGVGVIAFSGGKKSEETASAAKPAASAAAEKKDEKASPIAATATASAVPQPADPAPAASASVAPELVAKNDPKMAGTVAAPGGTGNAPPTKAGPGAASASAKPTATIDPIHKPSGGSLDDVLGIGKDDPSKKAVATPDSNLPEKPDTGDIRSAVLGKQGAAQSCVKGLDGDSSVAVTFGPAGNVTAVVVTSGPAKGTGAETCIKNAFNGAKVPASKKGGTGYAKLLQ
ncbi:MAG: hypothetical protein IPJ34_40010 [Myxococcales bacterium]|nr:hypothetical protein [Myxococcales bacterium]